MAAFLASTGRCDGIQVSIDGSVSITHDVFRGAGNFTKAIQGIEFLQKHDLPVSVRVTIHRENVKDLRKIARLLLEDYKLAGFSTNAASYMGLCRQNSESVQLTVAERTLAMRTLLKLHNQYNGRISGTAGPLAEARTWQKMEQARRQRKKQIPDGGYLTGCGGPMETIAVRADGVIVPCIQMSHIELGIINQDDLKTVWQNQVELQNLRNRCHIPLRDFEFCEGCGYINYCTGNCPALAYLITGEENHPSPDACLKSFLAKGGKLPDDIPW
jgi:SynChlorMet cassette radical SAM/SPASM protein ScmE